MADWKHKLIIGDLHRKHERKEITPEELGKEVAKRLTALLDSNSPPIPDDLLDEAQDIANRFECDIENVEDYDNVLRELYDWGDSKLPSSRRVRFSMVPKLCWIDAF